LTLLEHLARRTSTGRFIPEIDGLRFVSVAMVVLFHLHVYAWRSAPPGNPLRAWPLSLLEHGGYGVRFFFAISGFILGLPFALHYLRGRPVPRVRTYLLRRLTRLEPPYLLSLLLLFPVYLWSTGASAGSVLPHLLASMLYLHNAVYETGSIINGVTWSLELEVQFYLLAPVLAWLFFRQPRAAVRRGVLALVIAAGSVASIWLIEMPYVRLALPAYLHFFLVGFLLADLYATRWNSAPGRTPAWDLAWVAAWAGLLWVWGLSPAVSAIATPPLVFVLYVAALRGYWVRRALAYPWVATIGGMCYTIYLLHVPVISAGGRVWRALAGPASTVPAFALQCAVMGAAILVVSGVYFVLVERPCMERDWPRRLAGRVRAWLPGAPRVATAGDAAGD